MPQATPHHTRDEMRYSIECMAMHIRVCVLLLSLPLSLANACVVSSSSPGTCGGCVVCCYHSYAVSVVSPPLVIVVTVTSTAATTTATVTTDIAHLVSTQWCAYAHVVSLLTLLCNIYDATRHEMRLPDRTISWRWRGDEMRLYHIAPRYEMRIRCL